jgi:hypothetical protein
MQIVTVIGDSPSLRSFPAVLDQCYVAARARAALETRLPTSDFPEQCPFELEKVRDARWLPDWARSRKSGAE